MNEIDRELNPARLLARVCDPAGWHSTELIAFGGGLYRWSAEEIADIENALDAFKSMGRGFDELSAVDFPLSNCERKLSRILSELENGLGFVLIMDFPVSRLSAQRAETLMRGFEVHFQKKRERHIRQGKSAIVAQINFETIPVHVRLVSGITIYNEMLKREPEFISHLVRGSDENDNATTPKSQPALFNFYEGCLSVTDAARAGVSTGAHEKFVTVARELEHHLELRPGNMLFRNDDVILQVSSEESGPLL